MAANLESMPAIDTTVVLGYLPLPLAAASAYELVGDAMKLELLVRQKPHPQHLLHLDGETVVSYGHGR